AIWLWVAMHNGLHGVDDVTDVAVDVVTEGAQRDADLVRGDSGTAGNLDGVDEVGDERAHAVVDALDRCAHLAQDGVAVQPDLSDRHHAAFARRPSTRAAAISRAARRVAGCRLP